jgi:hypothetical protein
LVLPLAGAPADGAGAPRTEENGAAAAQDASGQQASGNQDDSSSSHGLPNPFHDRRDRIYYPGDTEQVKPLVTKLVGNVLLDQKESG